MKMNKNKLLVIAGIAALILSFLLGLTLQRTPEIKPKTDTVTVTKWERDTFRIDSIVPKYIETIKTVHDTLLTRDSIPIEVEIPIQMAYVDTIITQDKDTLHLQQTIEGYKPVLRNTVATINRRETITTITNTITKTKKPLITLSPMAGFGIGITSKKIDAFVGVGLALNI